MATCAANPVNPAHPGRLLVVPKQSELHFFSLFIDFDALRTSEIIEKPLENLGFYRIFIFSAKSLPDQKKVALGRAGILKMEARGTQNHSPRHQNDSWELQDEAQ